jgi:hypothetical protein
VFRKLTRAVTRLGILKYLRPSNIVLGSIWQLKFWHCFTCQDRRTSPAEPAVISLSHLWQVGSELLVVRHATRFLTIISVGFWRWCVSIERIPKAQFVQSFLTPVERPSAETYGLTFCSNETITDWVYKNTCFVRCFVWLWDVGFCYENKVKLPLCLTKNHAMKTYWGSRAKAPRVLNLGIRWRWDVNFKSRPLYTRGNRKNINHKCQKERRCKIYEVLTVVASDVA